MSRLPKKAKPPIRIRSVTKRVTESERSPCEPEPRVEIVEGNPPPFDGPQGLRLLRFSAVRARTGLSRSTIWRLEQCGAFPKHRRLSANTVAWVEGEVMSWIQSKIDPPIAV